MVKIVGHRGASALELENSFSAFEAGLEAGASILEMDVHLSKDGEVIVIHDDKVNRVTKSKGYVRHFDLERLKEMKLKNGEQIPTLKEVLEQFRGRCQFFVEIKTTHAVLSSYEVVKELDMLEDVVFLGFQGPWLLTLKRRDENVRVGFGTRDKKQNNIQIASSLKAEVICLEKKMASKGLIEASQKNGLAVYVWTVDKPKLMRNFIELGVDGIITNKPDILNKILNEL